jgi:hypothetical protein
MASMSAVGREGEQLEGAGGGGEAAAGEVEHVADTEEGHAGAIAVDPAEESSEVVLWRAARCTHGGVELVQHEEDSSTAFARIVEEETLQVGDEVLIEGCGRGEGAEELRVHLPQPSRSKAVHHDDLGLSPPVGYAVSYQCSLPAAWFSTYVDPPRLFGANR